jgi:hypothetical protein
MFSTRCKSTVGLSAAILLLTAKAALAWDGAVSGIPTVIDVTDGNNYGFRVYVGSQAMCGNANNWGYLNSTDSNYSAYVAAILMAKAQGSTLVVYSNRDANGYCHIGYMTQN